MMADDGAQELRSGPQKLVWCDVQSQCDRCTGPPRAQVTRTLPVGNAGAKGVTARGWWRGRRARGLIDGAH
jgi:hypothetical protein